MTWIKELWLSFAVVVVSGFLFAFLVPPIPIDETRYLAVAWDMKLNHSFLVPLLNGLSYSHKPPLLFWLIDLNWALFGVNGITLRLIPVLFSLGNIAMVYRIALGLWEEREVARYAALILSSTLIYLVWSALIMFDVILTFWVLVGVSGILAASRRNRILPWLVVGLAVGGGILTKGPVVLVHLMPPALFGAVWTPSAKQWGRWYGGIFLALSVGVGITLIWLIPAVTAGDDAYRQAILWGQTANRVVSSFAHRHPFWWYLPLLPILGLPWVLLKPMWRGWAGAFGNASSRLLLTWIVSTFLFFSCISGKQIHYLIPLLPAVSLLMARQIVRHRNSHGVCSWRYPVAILYALLAVGELAVQWVPAAHGLMTNAEALCMAGGFATLAALILFLKPRSVNGFVDGLAVSSALCLVILLVGSNGLMTRYDIRGISAVLKAKQEAGYEIIHYGNYHGQYQFIGRLTRPLVVLPDLERVRSYVATHDKVLLLTYDKRDTPLENGDVLFQQLYRGGRVVLWNNRGLVQLVAR